MRVSLNWLREFVPYEGKVDGLADTLTMLGLEVDEISAPFAEIEDVVVGRVTECSKHPDADKLSLCTVDVGGEILSIVCGAPNVAAGQTVPVAKVGARLPEGLVIKKAKIRGVTSMGMICSERELGLSDGHKGIMVLSDALKPGENFIDALNLERVVLDIDLTPNRADCLSILGVAREVANAFSLPLTMPTFELKEEGEPCEEQVRLSIDDGDACPLYQTRIIRGVKVGPSPDDVRFRLMAIGVRPINNVVDATNYVLMELGHPQHSFDEDLIAGHAIRVGFATDGMKFTTLDGQERKLTGTDLMIYDAERPVGLAGVMGGENSEIHDGSSNVLLECAVFKPALIRKTARRLALPSEASHRFERGVDQARARLAVDRCAAMIAANAGGQVLPGVASAEPKPWVQPTLTFRPSRAVAVLGIDLSDEFCASTLRGLQCEVTENTDKPWTVLPPSHRLDLEREIDLVEEVGRVYGLDKVPTELPTVKKPFESVVSHGEYEFVSHVKHWARGVGLRECINYSFVGERDLDILGEPTEKRVMIANPMSEDNNVMRSVVFSGLLGSLKVNISQGNTDFRLFEVAKTFHEDATTDTGVFEQTHLCILLHGRRFSGGYPWPGEESDYSDIKGYLEELCRFLGLDAPACELVPNHAWLEPAVAVSVAGKEAGVMGMVKADIADAYEARKEVWAVELSLNVLGEMARSRLPEFNELPKFPSTKRDVTLISPKSLKVAEVIAAVQATKTSILEEVALIDQFVPEKGNERNLTFRMTYRHGMKTLKDTEVDKIHAKIVKALTSSLPVSLQG